MHSYSLNESPSSARIKEQISRSQVTKQYLQKQNDKLMKDLEQLIEQANPKEQYKKITEMRYRAMNELKMENKNLLQKNRLLQEENRQLRKRLSQDRQEIIESQTPPKSKSNSSSNSSLFSPDNKAFLPEDQALRLQEIERLQNQARQIARYELQTLQKSMILLQITFEKLQRMIQLQKMSSIQDVKRQQLYEKSQTIVVEREKYEKLLDFYVNKSVVLLKKHPANGKQGEENLVEQFSVDEPNIQNLKQTILQIDSTLTNATELQSLFYQIAIQHNLKQEWHRFLTMRKEQGETFMQKIKAILEESYDNKSKTIIKDNLKIINTSISTHFQKTQSLSRTLSIIEGAQNEIQDLLFTKLTKIVEHFQFSLKEKELFKRFDEKRQCGRLFSVDQFLDKFKNQQDLTEITNSITNYIIKTMNSLALHMMDVLCENPQRSQTILTDSPQKWLISKIDKKSSDIKKRLFEALETQSSIFLSQKHPKKKLSEQQQLKQRNVVLPITNPKFDKDKQLERELFKIVTEYKQILESCVLNFNKKIYASIM